MSDSSIRTNGNNSANSPLSADRPSTNDRTNERSDDSRRIGTDSTNRTSTPAVTDGIDTTPTNRSVDSSSSSVPTVQPPSPNTGTSIRTPGPVDRTDHDLVLAERDAMAAELAGLQDELAAENVANAEASKKPGFLRALMEIGEFILRLLPGIGQIVSAISAVVRLSRIVADWMDPNKEVDKADLVALAGDLAGTFIPVFGGLISATTNAGVNIWKNESNILGGINRASWLQRFSETPIIGNFIDRGDVESPAVYYTKGIIDGGKSLFTDAKDFVVNVGKGIGKGVKNGVNAIRENHGAAPAKNDTSSNTTLLRPSAVNIS